jgi:hypothetical protein
MPYVIRQCRSRKKEANGMPERLRRGDAGGARETIGSGQCGRRYGREQKLPASGKIYSCIRDNRMEAEKVFDAGNAGNDGMHGTPVPHASGKSGAARIKMPSLMQCRLHANCMRAWHGVRDGQFQTGYQMRRM